MSRLSANILVLLAGGCGVLTAYATFQPEFERQAAERRGDFSHQHPSPAENENALSSAIVSDFKEAGEQLKDTSKGGFAWGIRRLIAGQKEPAPPQTEQKASPPQANADTGR